MVSGIINQDHAHLEISFVNADFQFRSVLLELGDKLLGDPLLVLVAVGNEHVVEVAHVLFLHVSPLPALLHQPK